MMNTRLSPGDPIPSFRFADQNDLIVPIYNQVFAGDPVALVLCPSAAEPAAAAVLAGFAARAEAFKTLGIHVFPITARPVAENREAAQARGLPFRVLSDPKGELLALAGVGEPKDGTSGDAAFRTILLRPNLRILDSLDPSVDGHADRALERLGPLAPKADAPVVRATAPVLIVDEIFPPDLCGRLIGQWDAGDKADDTVSGHQGSYASSGIKQRSDHVLRDPGLNGIIHGLFMRRLIPEMAKAYQFRVTGSEALRIGCYDARTGGFFRRHRDTGLKANEHRRFALSLNLNTGDYDGGQVRFPEFGPHLYEAPRGGGLLFSCSLLHEAMPVTRGRRFALFTFFSGEIFTR